MCSCLLCAPYLGTWPTTQHVPWLGIEPATLWFTDLRSIHWAAPVVCKFILFFNAPPKNIFIDFREREVVGERERGRERERERETLTWERHWPGQAYNLGMCPDWELNLQSFGVWDNTPTGWATRPGLYLIFMSKRMAMLGSTYDDLHFTKAWMCSHWQCDQNVHLKR